MQYRVSACLTFREEECERCRGDGRERISQYKWRICPDCGGSGAIRKSDIRMDCRGCRIPRKLPPKPLPPYPVRRIVSGWSQLVVDAEGCLMLSGVEVKPGDPLEILVNHQPEWTVWVTGTVRCSVDHGWCADVVPCSGAEAVTILLGNGTWARRAAPIGHSEKYNAS